MKSFEKSAQLLKKLSSGTKLDIIQLLVTGQKPFQEIQESLGLEQSLLSHHLKELRDLDFLVSQREGRNTFYRIDTRYYNRLNKSIELGCCELKFKKEMSR